MNAVLVTIRLRADDYLIGFDSDVSNLLNENMVKSLDTIARTAVDAAGTAVAVNAGGAASNTASDVITAALVREQHANLVAGNVLPWFGDKYAAVIAPFVEYDLKDETGDGSWVAPAQYVRVEQIYNNEVGTFGGFRFVSSNRTNLDADGGSGNVDNYTTYFFGKQFLAKAETIAPHMVMGPVTDTLMRHRPLGWHAYLGYGEFRSAALRRLISASSIGANT